VEVGGIEEREGGNLFERPHETGKGQGNSPGKEPSRRKKKEKKIKRKKKKKKKKRIFS